MDEQRHINLLEAYIDGRLTPEERRELESLLVTNAAMRTLFWETMQQHAFTQELLSEAQGRSIALTESRAATLATLKKEAAELEAQGLGAGLVCGPATGTASAATGPRSKTGRQSGPPARRAGRNPAQAGAWLFWMSVAAGVLMVAGIGGYVYLHEAPVTPLVAKAQSIASVQAVGSNGGYLIRGTSSYALTAPLDLLPGDLIKTNPGAKDATASTVTYTDGTRLQLAAGAAITFVESAPTSAKRLELDEGSLVATVSPQPTGKPMTVQTPQAEIRVVGTQFVLAVTGEKTRLQVHEGHVQLTRQADKQTVEVLAKQYVDAAAGLELAVKPMEEPHPVVATEPKHEPAHVEEFGSDELQGRVLQINDKGSNFTVQVIRAGNHELVGREVAIYPAWNAERKMPRETDIKQIHELRTGDVVRVRMNYDEHWRIRTLTVVEKVRRDEPKPHETPAEGLEGRENHDGKDTKTLPGAN